MDAVCPVFLSAPLLLSPSPTSLPSLISTHLHFNSSTKFQQIPQPSQISSLWTLTFSVLMCSPPCLDFDLNDFFFFIIWEITLDPRSLHSCVAWDTFSSATVRNTPNYTGWRVPLPGSPGGPDLLQADGLVLVSWRHLLQRGLPESDPHPPSVCIEQGEEGPSRSGQLQGLSEAVLTCHFLS